MTLPLSPASLEAKLATLQQCPHVPPRLAAFVSGVVRAQHTAAQEITPRVPKVEVSAEQHAQGMPLVALSSLTWNKRDAEKLFKTLLATTAAAPDAQEDNLAKGGAMLEKAIKDGSFVIQEALVAASRHDATFFLPWIDKITEAPDLVRFLAMNTLLPFWYTAAQTLVEKANSPQPWTHGHCPVCGGIPVMGVLEGKEGVRKHTCSQCRHTYRVPRLQCAFCLTEKPDGTVVYKADELPGYQVHVCDECKGYMKLVDAQERDGTYLAGIDDVLSLPFDYKAVSLGYSRPAAFLPGA